MGFDEGAHMRQRTGHVVPVGNLSGDDDAPPERDGSPALEQDLPDGAGLERTNTEEGELRAQPRARGHVDQSAADVRYPRRERRTPGNWFEVNHHAHVGETQCAKAPGRSPTTCTLYLEVYVCG
jgi:hypothetical protein